MTKNIKIEKEREINNMNNRFVQIGNYEILGDSGSVYCADTINELVDMNTGIVYMRCHFRGEFGGHQMQPMLYDNGKPKHLNKDELMKIKIMIERLDCEFSSTEEYEYENYKDMTCEMSGDWTLEEIYNKVFPDPDERKAYEIAYMEKLNSN